MRSRLQKRIEAVRRQGMRGRGRWLRVCSGPDPEGGLVISVRRKFGKAVRRNRVRRQIRAICRDLSDGSWTARLTLLSVDDQASEVPFAELREDLARALLRAGVPVRETRIS
jgi:ribonuclease P protein component